MAAKNDRRSAFDNQLKFQISNADRTAKSLIVLLKLRLLRGILRAFTQTNHC